MEKKGIDVSKWQGEIQWSRVRQDGVEFAIIRAAAGLTPDPNGEQNIRGALAARVPVGLYLYSYAGTIAQVEKEADVLIRLAELYDIQYPLALDMEDDIQKKLTNRQRTDIALAFSAKVREAGFIPMLYASKSWLETMLETSRLGDLEIWVAQWGNQNTYQGEYGMWQYSNTGKVSGIVGNVDLDCACKDYPAMLAAQKDTWVYRGGRWYYGDLKNCWKKIDGRWYWFEADGMAATGIREINGKWYAFANKTVGPVKECQCLITDENGALR